MVTKNNPSDLPPGWVLITKNNPKTQLPNITFYIGLNINQVLAMLPYAASCKNKLQQHSHIAEA